MRFSFHRLITFLPLFCNCQISSVPLLPSAYSGSLASRNSTRLDSTTVFESESYITIDGQPASLSWSKAPIWGLRPDVYYICDSYGLVLVGRPLWREVGSVFFMCCCSLPAQSFSGPSPLGLETIFYCLIFETSLFVASYDSQGHGGGIRHRLHTGSVSLLFLKWSFLYNHFARTTQKTHPLYC
jgi:hypothetical protein